MNLGSPLGITDGRNEEMKVTLGKLALIAAILVAGAGFSTAAASAATPTQSVRLVCTSTASLNYAVEVVILSAVNGGNMGGPQLNAAVTAFGNAARAAGQPFIAEGVSLGSGLTTYTKTANLAPTNHAFAALASSCRVHGDPIVLFTITLASS